MQSGTSFPTVSTSLHERVPSVAIDLRETVTAGLVSSTLLAGAAAAWTAVVSQQMTPVDLFRWVARGIFDADSLSEAHAIIYGGLLHLGFCLAFAAAYSILVQRVTLPGDSDIIVGLAYGAFAGLFMLFVVLPLTDISLDAFDVNRLVLFVVAHMLLVGLPISLIVGRRNARRN